MSRRVEVAAHANIALAKYWGKMPGTDNLSAVPSLSLTVDGLRTVTSVHFLPELAEDHAIIDGIELCGRPLDRVRALLDRVRGMAGVPTRAEVSSTNEFPTASGLASSASGFAALGLAAARALGLDCSLEAVSAIARASSASAARSLMGGFVSLGAGSEQAERVAPPEHWDLVLLVAVTSLAPKPVSSTSGMLHTAQTSPYYRSWVEEARLCYQTIRRAVLARRFDELGVAMEESTLMMHAAMLAARPALCYWSPATVGLMDCVRDLRAGGRPAYFTIDAGPHVKVLTLPEHAPAVGRELSRHPGVVQLLIGHPGPDAQVIEGKP